MNRFFAVLAVVVVIVIAVGCWVGWITFHHSPEKATIEIQTKQIEQAGEKAAESSRQLVEEATDSVKKAVQDGRGGTSAEKSDETTTASPSPTSKLR